MSDNISETSKEFSKVGKGINKDLPQIMARLDAISKYLEGVSATLDAKLPTALDKFVKLEDNLNDTIDGNKDKLSSALTSVDGFFSSSTETMQKVDKYLDGMIKSELHVEMRSDEVYDDGGYSKSHLNLTLKPDPSRYYMLGVTSGPSFESDDKFDRGYAGNKKHESGDFLLSAQYGKRFDDLLFRVGLIEGQGGFGVDYFALNDTLKVTANMFDFNAVNDIRGENLNLTTTMRYQFFKHINAYVSANNILNSRANSMSAGLGVSFIDNDLKNLLGTAASSAN
jgi:phospholipid/cholesterol/gamma-HCH transport system substrate-binding protein